MKKLTRGKMLFRLGSLFLVMSVVSGKSLPPDIKKCSLSDPNLNTCLDTVVAEAVHKLSSGNKDLGIVPLEPLFIEKIDLGESNAGGSVNIHQIYTNLRLHGITNATLSESDANFSDDNCYWNFKSTTNRVVMDADYTMKGQLLIFPINGHGKCKNILSDIQAHYRTRCVKYTKKNKKYVKITDFEFKISPKKVEFHFDNIIDGNEQLSKEVDKTINENALEIYKEIGSAFDNVMGTIWKQTINQVFARVPEDELFLR